MVAGGTGVLPMGSVRRRTPCGESKAGRGSFLALEFQKVDGLARSQTERFPVIRKLLSSRSGYAGERLASPWEWQRLFSCRQAPPRAAAADSSFFDGILRLFPLPGSQLGDGVRRPASLCL